MFELADKKKMPRLLLAHPDEAYKTIAGAFFVWPKGGRSQLLDMSYAGLVISSAGILDKVKMGEFLEAHVLLPSAGILQIPVNVRVVKKTAGVIGFRVDSISTDGRIKIDQPLKDSIVAEGLQKLSPQYLQAGSRSDEWMHGPFDTNLFIWKSGEQITKVLIEYDNSVAVLIDGDLIVARTSSSVDEAAGYCGPFLAKDFGKQKLSLGHGWAHRLLQVLKASPLQEPQVLNFLETQLKPYLHLEEE